MIGSSEAHSLLCSVSLVLLFISMHASLILLSPLWPPTTSWLQAHPWDGEQELPVLQGCHSLYFSRSYLFPVPVPRALLLSIKSCCHGLHSSWYKGGNTLWVMQNLRTKPKFYCSLFWWIFFQNWKAWERDFKPCRKWKFCSYHMPQTSLIKWLQAAISSN